MSLGTKEVSERLGVSQSTLKRWIARFPDVFRKDRSGRYLFAEQDWKLLEEIKTQVRSGVPLENVVLPRKPAPERAGSGEGVVRQGIGSRAETAPPAIDMLLLRLEHLERSVAQKADEVVAAQLYQQRLELEELRRLVNQLAGAVEGMRESATARAAEVPSAPPSASPLPSAARSAGAPVTRAKKRKRFWLFGG